MDIKEIARELGKLGGKKTAQKYGNDYFRKLQKLGVEAKKKKKERIPSRTKVLELNSKGIPHIQIAKELKISRQRVHQIITGYRSYSSKALSYKNIHFRTDSCEKCGSKTEIIHHIDGNSNNNAPENLMPLCIACHAEIHKPIVK